MYLTYPLHLTFFQDDKRLVTGGQEKIIQIFDLEKPEAEALKLEGHTQAVKTALWSSDDSLIISGGQDSQLIFWDTRTLKPTKTVSTKAPVASVELSLDGKHMTTAAGKEVSFWDINT